MYMLDTNACIHLIRKRGGLLLERLRSITIGDVGISVITLAELQHGVARSGHPEKNHLALLEFCASLNIYSFDDHAALSYGQLRAQLESAGKVIGPMDMLIAAHAMCLNCVLVTNNLREFRRVPGLICEDWSR